MPEQTTTTWTCSRCKRGVTLAGTAQPKDWVAVGFVNPPRASWTDSLTRIGHLCNDEECQGLLVAFMSGDESQEKYKIDCRKATEQRARRAEGDRKRDIDEGRAVTRAEVSGSGNARPMNEQEILEYARRRYATDAEFHARVTVAVGILANERRLDADEREFALTAAAVGLAMQWVDPQTGRISDD